MLTVSNVALGQHIIENLICHCLAAGQRLPENTRLHSFAPPAYVNDISLDCKRSSVIQAFCSNTSALTYRKRVLFGLFEISLALKNGTEFSFPHNVEIEWPT